MSKAKKPTTKKTENIIPDDAPREFDQIVKLYQGLTPREKLLIDTFDTLCCLEINNGIKTTLDTRIRDAVKVDIADVPTDAETQWLLSVNQLAYAGLQ